MPTWIDKHIQHLASWCWGEKSLHRLQKLSRTVQRLQIEQQLSVCSVCFVFPHNCCGPEGLLLSWVWWLLGCAQIQYCPESLAEWGSVTHLSPSVLALPLSVHDHTFSLGHLFVCSLYSNFQDPPPFTSPRPRALLCWNSLAISCDHICSVSLPLWGSLEEQYK